ncbi:MAG: DUF1684 domain-containing protein [Gemmatimonadaceae bacterium]|nr:DUF1684 domain-containing protein [Gemmatimonadaceae bacterium]
MLALTACESPREAPPIGDEAWTKQLDTQFAGLRRIRTGETSVLSWSGLWPLPEGRTTFGSGADQAIRLDAPEVPPSAGVFVRAGTDVLVEPSPGTKIQLADGTVIDGPFKLISDIAKGTTALQFGTTRVVLHEEPTASGRWIRASRSDAAAITGYTDPPRYAANRAYRVAAKLLPSSTGITMDLPDVTGGTQQFALAGELSFRLNGESLRLLAFKRPGRDSLFVMFRDATSGTTTYDAARYVYVPRPDAENWTVLDFNKAHNPPCAFTTFSTCVLPPKANRLTVPIEAGEQLPTAPRIGAPAAAGDAGTATASPSTPRPRG